MILFCEYVVLNDCRENYLSWVKERLNDGASMQALENTAQSGVFVEIWQVRDADHAAHVEKERREGRSWKAMTLWIKGGKDGLRIWTFRPIETFNE